MKTYVYVTFFLICLSIASAGTHNNIYLEEGKSVKLDGKNITYITSGTGDKFVFNVDGVQKIIRSGEYINGVEIYINSLFHEMVSANITVKYKCGDKECERGETSTICCTDCGCENNLSCINNICQEVECEFNDDCDDKDKCTVDSCKDNRCYHTAVNCINNDGCCPENCTPMMDNDCSLDDECQSDEDCSDSLLCTTDQCDGEPKRCIHNMVQGCESGGECRPIGTVEDNAYCGENDWEYRKDDGRACKESYECLSNQCIDNVCGEKTEENYTIRNMLIVNAIIIALLIVWLYISHKKKKF